MDAALDWSTLYLYLGQNGDNRDDDAQDKVEADEDLVLCAVVRLRVVDVEKHHSSDSQSVVDEGERQQAWKWHGHTFTHMD